MCDLNKVLTHKTIYHQKCLVKVELANYILINDLTIDVSSMYLYVTMIYKNIFKLPF